MCQLPLTENSNQKNRHRKAESAVLHFSLPTKILRFSFLSSFLYFFLRQPFFESLQPFSPFSFLKFFSTMDFRSKGTTWHTLFVLFLLFSDIFPLSFSAANQPHKAKNLATPHRLSSSAVFKVQGNVYPLGYLLILS